MKNLVPILLDFVHFWNTKWRSFVNEIWQLYLIRPWNGSCIGCQWRDRKHRYVIKNTLHLRSKDECKSFGFGTVMKELITDDRIQIFKRTVPLNNVFSYRKIVSTLFHLTIAIVINDSPVFVLFFPHVLFWILTVLNLDCFAVKFFFCPLFGATPILYKYLLMFSFFFPVAV